MKTLSILLALIVFLYWWTGDGSDETTLYSARCANDITIYPRKYLYSTIPIDELSGGAIGVINKKHFRDTHNCIIDELNTDTYILNKTKGEVYLKYGLTSGWGFREAYRLVDCAIIDNKNWGCVYPEEPSRKFVVVDGIQSITRSAIIELESSPITKTLQEFPLRRWQWLFASIYGGFGEGPSHNLLIPSQRYLHYD